MNEPIHNDMPERIRQAVAGNKQAMESLLLGVQDLVFNLSLRMLGTVPDAEDASQEILIRIMTHLSSFKGESSFTTWVYRLAVNHLKNYRKHMFAQYPLSFEYYGADILNGKENDVPDLSEGVERGLLEQELKMSCMNVMLQCLDTESRCIFVLGTMFRLDSRLAGDILGMSAEAYRQRLSRVRKRMARFLDEYCGAGGNGCCACKSRIDYAIQSKRIDPHELAFGNLEETDARLTESVAAMDEIDDLSIVFASMPAYRATPAARQFITDVIRNERYAFLNDLQGDESHD